MTRYCCLTKFAVFIVFSLILAACGSVQQRTERDGLVVDDGTVSVDPFYQVPESESSQESGGYRSAGGPNNTASSPNQTVLALLSQAKRQERAGQPERAAAVIERALRIDPKNAELWYRLALLRLQQGQYALAASLAAKSKALAQGNTPLQRKNQILIHQTRILRGQ
jgi:tetratricopeptide (TPR) repeat protein